MSRLETSIAHTEAIQTTEQLVVDGSAFTVEIIGYENEVKPPPAEAITTTSLDAMFAPASTLDILTFEPDPAFPDVKNTPLAFLLPERTATQTTIQPTAPVSRSSEIGRAHQLELSAQGVAR